MESFVVSLSLGSMGVYVDVVVVADWRNDYCKYFLSNEIQKRLCRIFLKLHCLIHLLIFLSVSMIPTCMEVL